MSIRRDLSSGMATAVALLLVSCSLSAASQSTPSPASQSGLTASERAALAGLESRPLAIPAMPADGGCPDGPQSKAAPFGSQSASYLAATGGMLYGTGPVYFLGGGGTDGTRNKYFGVTFFTDPATQGVALVRGQQLGGRWNLVMVGPWTAGAAVETDTIGGQHVTLHSELALPSSRPPSKPGLAPGWGIWEVNLGIDKQDTSLCVGLQIDSASGTEVFVVAG